MPVLEHVILNEGSKPILATVICTYKRQERLFTCIKCLYSSMVKLTCPSSIIIMDNNDDNTLFKPLMKYFKQLEHKLMVTYLHYPRVNLSQLRNTAVKFISNEVRYILFLDSDIYISNSTLPACLHFLEGHLSVDAIAPPLVSYQGGDHLATRKKSYDAIALGGDNIIMPSSYDYSKNKISEQFLETHMLRGAFILRRHCLTHFFNSEIWIPAFNIWQNVPFFLTLSELNKTFGYLLDPATIALHDDRTHADTIENKMHNWHAESIKAIVLIFFRNRLWLAEQQILNFRFINTIKEVIKRHVESFTSVTIYVLFDISRSISMNRANGIKELNNIEMSLEDNVIITAINLLKAEKWRNFRKIRSLNLEKEI